MGAPFIVLGEDQLVGDWVAAKIGNKTPWHDYVTIGIGRDGHIIGGAVIDNYILHARCSVHCAGSEGNWLNRQFLEVVFDYIFRQLKCNAVINVVRGSNAPSLRFTQHIGFKEFHRIPGGSTDGTDAVMFQLLKADCRWYKEKELA